MTIEGQEGQKEEGVSTVAIRGDKKLLSFISNVGLSLPQGITFGRLSKRNSNCLSMTLSEAREWTKSKRTTFYQMLSREFPQLQARTVQDETGQVIEVRQKPSKKRLGFRCCLILICGSRSEGRPSVKVVRNVV